MFGLDFKNIRKPKVFYCFQGGQSKHWKKKHSAEKDADISKFWGLGTNMRIFDKTAYIFLLPRQLLTL